MPNLADKDAGFLDLKLVHEGPNARVAAEPQIFEVLKTLAELDPRWGELEELMERYCNNIPFTKKQWNFEGRHPDGTGKEVGILAFKGWQIRLYGFQRSVAGQKCFVATGIDVSKKTTVANQKLLKKAAKTAAPYTE